MGNKKTKKRTHVKVKEEDLADIPRSFVFGRGDIPPPVKHLVSDMREVMRPFVALNLKEQRKNTLKDFVHVAGPIGVTHFIIFTSTTLGCYMRIAKLPRGPTLTFKVEEYSYISDVAKIVKKHSNNDLNYKYPPLLIMNNFSSTAEGMDIASATIQNLFPPLDVNNTSLSDCRRCALFNFDNETNTIMFRHYSVGVEQVGVSKVIKNLTTNVPDLSQFDDVSEFIKAQSAEAADPLSVTESSTKRGQTAIQLNEIGPRLNLKLIAIEEGFCEGTPLFRLPAAAKASEASAKGEDEGEGVAADGLSMVKERARAKRVRRKMLDPASDPKKAKKLKRAKAAKMEKSEDAVSDDNDDLYYLQEVGVAPDKRL
eukprot:GCRY01004025.1.p1 GENE.GCRY01004025.1~~GCRY01004025.1.p1  ORF type:complete len:382 (-),score=91.48 GCRY01004025.1:197-1303(-)